MNARRDTEWDGPVQTHVETGERTRLIRRRDDDGVCRTRCVPADQPTPPMEGGNA